MAARGLDIIVKVRDAASGELKNVQRSLDDTGKSVKKAGIDFTQFNKVMFSTSAFINLFKKTFSDIGSSIMEGAELDRVQTQFENVLGPSGALFTAIRGMTGTAIDRVEAMRAGIAMKTLGIAGNMEQVAELIARSGDAAKQAGLDSSEGVKKFTQFLKDGSFSSLEFLNLIRSSDPALKAQLSILKTVGGVFGSALTAQEKYNMGLSLLRAATRGMNKDNRDLLDVMIDLGQSFKFLKGAVGTFLGTAIKPLLDDLGSLFDKWSMNLQQITKNDKNLLFLAKSTIIVTSALAGLIAVLGTLRLTVIALNSVGIGLPFLSKIIFGLAAAFIGLTYNVDRFDNKLSVFDRFMDKLKAVAGFFRGIYQLVSSFLEADNFAKGIGKMDKSLYDMLEKNGILHLAIFISKLSAAIIIFAQAVLQDFRSAAEYIDAKVGAITDKLMKLFGLNKEGSLWARSIFDQSSVAWKGLHKVTAAAIALFIAFKAFKGIKGFLQGIPLIGKLFGGGAKGALGRGGPRGTKGDPIYTASAGIDVTKSVLKGDYFPTKIMTPLEAIANAVKQLLRDFRFGGIKYGISKGIPDLLKAIRTQTIRAAVATYEVAKASRLGRMATAVVQTVAPIFRPLIRVATPAVRAVGRVVRSVGGGAIRTAGNIVRGGGEMGLSALRGVGNFIMDMVRPLMMLKDIFKVRSLAALFESLEGFGTAIRVAGSRFFVVYVAFKALSGIVSSVVENFQSWKDLGSSVVQWISSAFQLAKVKVVEFFTDLPDLISGMWETLKSVGADVATGIQSWARNTFQEILAPFQDSLSGLGDVVKGAFNWVDEMISVTPVLSTFRDALTGTVSSVYNAFRSLVGGIIDLIKKIPGIGDMITEGWKGLADLGATFAENMAKNIKKSAIGMDLQRIETTHLVTAPDQEKDRESYLHDVMNNLEGVNDAWAQQIGSIIQQNLGHLSPEQFATALHAKLENSSATHAAKETAKEMKKANNKPQMTNTAKRGC